MPLEFSPASLLPSRLDCLGLLAALGLELLRFLSRGRGLLGLQGLELLPAALAARLLLGPEAVVDGLKRVVDVGRARVVVAREGLVVLLPDAERERLEVVERGVERGERRLAVWEGGRKKGESRTVSYLGWVGMRTGEGVGGDGQGVTGCEDGGAGGGGGRVSLLKVLRCCIECDVYCWGS